MGNQIDKDIKELSNSTKFSKKELEELAKEFKALDKDKSGELDKNEFKELFKNRMKHMNTNEEQLGKLFIAFDTDKSGTISFKEMATSLNIFGKGTPEEKLEYLFEMYDEDHNGTLSKDEIEKVLRQMMSVSSAMGRTNVSQTENFIKGIMTKLDADSSGDITKSEWISKGKSTPTLLDLLGANN